MSDETTKKYDDMTPEERDAYDKLEKIKEDEEQAALPYTWRQTLQDVNVTIPVPKGTRGRDLEVVIKKKQIKVALKGKPAIVEGELCKEIKMDDSTWSIEISNEWKFTSRKATK
ncbi:unnamed protein product [Absidia cylindrospora]